ncbi:hypothetical protein MIZ03_0515 [Rhodoferax lithotrophicus]|uniref:Uncharacterized protein n=1 Tax=Rhodoferax lithotrophicus TaxID=2798804 RepID=A0ABN6D4F4_9BURK|nr:hypothetical protein MIZ03_0515 [Rhodoferax sp. MIZ03]
MLSIFKHKFEIKKYYNFDSCLRNQYKRYKLVLYKFSVSSCR